MPPENDDDKVGYKRPPKSGQFKKGQSGNKNGRPKEIRPGVSNFSTTLKNVLEADVVVRTKEGKKRRMTKMDVMLERLVNKAIEGDTRALFSVVKMTTAAGLFETLPETKKRYGGVLVVNGTQELDVWRKKAEENQRKYREAPYVNGPPATK